MGRIKEPTENKTTESIRKVICRQCKKIPTGTYYHCSVDDNFFCFNCRTTSWCDNVNRIVYHDDICKIM